jgi:hypothetical protein
LSKGRTQIRQRIRPSELSYIAHDCPLRAIGSRQPAHRIERADVNNRNIKSRVRSEFRFGGPFGFRFAGR